MTITLTSQQVAYFKNNGFLELNELFTPLESKKYHTAILETLEHRKSGNEILRGRDLWRDSAVLKTLLCSRKLSRIANLITGKTAVRLGCDQWFTPSFTLSKPEKLKDLLSIQGLICAMLIQLQPGTFEIPEKTSPLGLLPFPKGQGNVLLVTPSLLLNWPAISATLGLYLVTYAEPTAIYTQNPRDPAGAILKELGYGYGDLLKSETNPLLYQT